MRIFLLFIVTTLLLSSMGCSGFPVQQTVMISSDPSGADLYLSEVHSTKESYLGKTPQTIFLVSERNNQWQIKAVFESYEPLEWWVYGVKEISHHFDVAFQDLSKAAKERRKKAEEERREAELMARLKARHDQFLQYGFDLLDFVNYAKATLRIKGEINFGGAIPEIGFRTFKNKQYVEVKVNYLVTYNTL